MPKFIKNLKEEGWAVYSCNQPIDKDQRSWQFYISVKPEKDNLAKALDALERLVVNDEELSKSRHPDIKVALPVNPQQHSHYFDVLMPPPVPGMSVCDQEQMGKEIVVSMNYDSHKQCYTCDPSKYKAIMLKIWKALEQGGVELNYITPDSDDFAVLCDDHIATPFSYCARKCESQIEGNGLLHSKDANPYNFADPLNGVKIKKEDLEAHEIQGGASAIVCYKRIDFMEQRIQAAKDALAKDIEQLLAAANEEINCQTILLSISKLLLITDSQQFIQETTEFFNKQMNACQKYLPHLSNGKLDPIFTEENVKNILKKEDLVHKSRLLRMLLKSIKDAAEANISFIVSRMIDNEEKAQLKDAIVKNPFIAQCLYRRIIHIQNCEQRLEFEQQNLINERHFPPTYEDLWQKQVGSAFDKARAILADYTKGGNFWSLLVTFHINRSPTQIDQVQKILTNSREIKDINTLMSRLKEIPLKDSGSLGMRIAFITKKCYQIMLAEAENRNDLAMGI